MFILDILTLLAILRFKIMVVFNLHVKAKTKVKIAILYIDNFICKFNYCLYCETLFTHGNIGHDVIQAVLNTNNHKLNSASDLQVS